MTAKMVIASAERLIEVRHFWRNRKRIAEMSVPACPIPTQNTKFVMSNAQPTGTLSPQTPIPSQKSHETATPRRPRSAREGKKKSHQPIGVRPSSGAATTSVIEWKSGERRMSVGRPATGLSSSSASVWAKPVPRVYGEKWPFVPSRIAGSQAPAPGGAGACLAAALRGEADREADLLEQRFEILSRGRNAGDDPRPGLPHPGVRARKRAHLTAGAEEPLPRLVRLGRELLKKRRRPLRAQDPRHARRQLARFHQPRVHAVHADRSRLVRGVPGEPEASLAEAPCQAALEQAERRPVNLGRSRRVPGSPRGDQLFEPLHRCCVFRGVPDLESPPTPPLLEGPVDARQVWIDNHAHFRGKLPRGLD